MTETTGKNAAMMPEIAVHPIVLAGIKLVLSVNVKRIPLLMMTNVKTKNPKSGATRIKRNVARKMFLRNVILFLGVFISSLAIVSNVFAKDDCNISLP